MDAPSQQLSPAMQDYYQLQRELLVVTLVMTVVIFISVYCFYSLNTALNYLVGACTGVVYLRMLARDVERLGSGSKRPGLTRFALFIGVFILATQVKPLAIVPIFLGFLTYKAALIIYMLRSFI